MATFGRLPGGLVEAFVVSELRKQRTWSDIDFRRFHFRNSDGKEVDIAMENARREIVALEVKATNSVTGRRFRGLEYLRERNERPLHRRRRAVHRNTRRSVRRRLWALPIASLWRA